MAFAVGFAAGLLWRRLEARVEALEQQRPDYTMPPRYDVELPCVAPLAELPEYVGPGLDDDEWTGVYV